MLTVEFRTMGCHARAVIDADGPDARAALDRLPAWLATRERLLSRFDAESALSRLNARGAASRIGEVLWSALDVALAAAGETGGLVTPTVLSALERAGYDRSFDTLERDQGGIRGPCPVPDWRDIERDRQTHSVRLPPGLRLDLGGTAKGWSADAAAASLAPFGPALVDLGGDISLGLRPLPWSIAIEDPRDGREPLDIVLLREGGIATSGRDFRSWRRGGLPQHHLIDPRTGAPARTDVWTATVVAGSALQAEVAAKRVLLEGSGAGLAWVESCPELAALLVRDDGHVLRSSRLAGHVWRDVA